MAVRDTPESFFSTRQQVQTQTPVQVESLQIAPLQLPTLDPNMIFILGLVAIVGLIGLFAYLGHEDKKCR